MSKRLLYHVWSLAILVCKNTPHRDMMGQTHSMQSFLTTCNSTNDHDAIPTHEKPKISKLLLYHLWMFAIFLYEGKPNRDTKSKRIPCRHF